MCRFHFCGDSFTSDVPGKIARKNVYSIFSWNHQANWNSRRMQNFSSWQRYTTKSTARPKIFKCVQQSKARQFHFTYIPLKRIHFGHIYSVRASNLLKITKSKSYATTTTSLLTMHTGSIYHLPFNIFSMHKSLMKLFWIGRKEDKKRDAPARTTSSTPPPFLHEKFRDFEMGNLRRPREMRFMSPTIWEVSVIKQKTRRCTCLHLIDTHIFTHLKKQKARKHLQHEKKTWLKDNSLSKRNKHLVLLLIAHFNAIKCTQQTRLIPRAP